jgi:hypothetical protein
MRHRFFHARQNFLGCWLVLAGQPEGADPEVRAGAYWAAFHLRTGGRGVSIVSGPERHMRLSWENAYRAYRLRTGGTWKIREPSGTLEGSKSQ